MCLGVHVCVQKKVSIKCVFRYSSTLHFQRQGLSLSLKFIDSIRLAPQQVLVSTSTALRFQACATMPGFFSGCWTSNSSPHVYTTSTLQTERSPQPLTNKCYFSNDNVDKFWVNCFLNPCSTFDLVEWRVFPKYSLTLCQTYVYKTKYIN